MVAPAPFLAAALAAACALVLPACVVEGAECLSDAECDCGVCVRGLCVGPVCPDDGPPGGASLTLEARALGGGSGALLVSNGVPFGIGELDDAEALSVFVEEAEVPVFSKRLGRWPDGSVRSALVQFEVPASALPAEVELRLGRAPAQQRAEIVPSWELPEAVALPSPERFVATGALGPLTPLGRTEQVLYDELATEGFAERMADRAPSELISSSDGLYSTPLTGYLLFARGGDDVVLGHARRELLHYRDDQLIPTGSQAGQARGHEGETRGLYMRALEADWLLFGDPVTWERAAQVYAYIDDGLIGTDDYYFRNDPEHLQWNETDAAWTLLGAVVWARMSEEPAVRAKLDLWVDDLLETQSPSGGWEHGLGSDDCPTDAIGGVPWKTSLLLEALIAYGDLSGDPRIVDAVIAAVDWMWDEGWQGTGFVDLAGCPGSGIVEDLSLLALHGFGYAWARGGRAARHLERGRTVLAEGIANVFLGSDKHYNQSFRSSPHFLGYLAEGGEVQ